ncbi:hypothetical protein JAO10_01030 [Burkholderia contaminans]|uniref:hypothetical protein n=1 Tax=Burkholderia contaminans TaxID=488447 RepID=UPI0018DCB459|nr:hypothetical protein [Burkholderia contaminans]MBH9718899.1 hypothetical protein [Burkholderia contaminans]
MDKIDANAPLSMPKTGGTFTGPVTITGSFQQGLAVTSTNPYSGIVIGATNNGTAYNPRIQANAQQNNIGFVNGANTAYIFVANDSGTCSLPVANAYMTIGGTSYASGSNCTIAPDGNIWGPQWGGDWLRNWLDKNKVQKTGDTMSGRLSMSNPGWQADIGLHNWRNGQDVWAYLRARDGGGVEFINSAYNAVVWSTDNNGSMYVNGSMYFNSGARVQNDGNIVGGNVPWGDYFSAFNAKANAGSQCVYNSGQIEWDYVGSVNSNIHGQIDMGNPWVSNGLRVNASTSSITAIWQRSIWLRNQ